MKSVATRLFALCSLLCLAVQANAAGDPMAGQTKTALCAACHGPSGISIAPLFPNLAGQGERYLLKQLKDIKAGNRVVIEMAGQLDNLTEQDLEDISAFYASQTGQVAGAKNIEDADWNLSAEEFLALGEKIYRNGKAEVGVPACTGCHSPSGQGNDPAGFPVIGGQHADYIAKQLNAFRNNQRVNDGETQIMRGVVKNMSDLEVRAVSNFISGLYY